MAEGEDRRPDREGVRGEGQGGAGIGGHLGDRPADAEHRRQPGAGRLQGGQEKGKADARVIPPFLPRQAGIPAGRPRGGLPVRAASGPAGRRRRPQARQEPSRPRRAGGGRGDEPLAPDARPSSSAGVGSDPGGTGPAGRCGAARRFCPVLRRREGPVSCGRLFMPPVCTGGRPVPEGRGGGPHRRKRAAGGTVRQGGGRRWRRAVRSAARRPPLALSASRTRRRGWVPSAPDRARPTASGAQEPAAHGAVIHLEVFRHVAFAGLHGVQHAGQLLGLLLHLDHIAVLHEVGGDVHPLAVHQHMAVVDELAGGEDGRARTSCGTPPHPAGVPAVRSGSPTCRPCGARLPRNSGGTASRRCCRSSPSASASPSAGCRSP